MLHKKTNKLFFNKWPFKVECYLKGASRITRDGVEQTIAWCSSIQGSDKWRYGIDRQVNKDELKVFALKTAHLLKREDIKIRTESGHFNIFCHDKSLVESLKKDLEPWVIAITEPGSDAEHEFLLESGHKKVLCEHYPYNTFRYKVFLKDKMQVDARQQFLSWVNKYPEKLQVTATTNRWLGLQRHYAQDPFMYVEDEKMLSMTLLYLGNNCKKVQEFILKSSINTPCPH